MKKIIVLSLLLGSLSFADNHASSLYEKCMGCHGLNGEKFALNKSQAISSMSEEEILEALKGYKNKSLNKYGLGNLMAGMVQNLSDEDLVSLSKFISTLNKEKEK